MIGRHIFAALCLAAVAVAGAQAMAASGYDWLLENPTTEPRRLIPSDPCGRGVDAMAREINRLRQELERRSK